jgi:hypothetical protein
MPRAPEYRRHWTSFAAHRTMGVGAVQGAAANISIQTRYCTATATDKPFSETHNLPEGALQLFLTGAEIRAHYHVGART